MTKSGRDTASVPYHHLLYQLMLRPRKNTRFGMSLALTSVNGGEGVTSVTEHLVSALQEISNRRVLQVNVAMLEHEVNLLHLTAADRMTDTVSQEKRSALMEGESPGDDRLSRQGCIRELSSRFDFLLIDCPALRQSGDVLSVASVVDGIIVVVQSGKTTKQDIAYAERQIIAAGGHVEGYILNHTQMSLSKWLRQAFKRESSNV